MLAWDAMVLNIYLIVNVAVILYVLYRSYNGLEVEKRILVPLVLASIPIAISTHTVTAFLFSGLAARPFWNASILAPRFLASAFCSGPAVMLVLFQMLRRRAELPIKDEAILKVAELMAYAIFINLFLLGAEVFKEFYSGTHHVLYTRYSGSGSASTARWCRGRGARSWRTSPPSSSSSCRRRGGGSLRSTSAARWSSSGSSSRRGWGSSSRG